MILCMAVIGVIGAYLVGSVSSAILVCKMMGLPDPRTEGSHNPGTTNVLRIGGKLPAALTLVGDVLKGVLAVLVARLLTQNEYIISAVLLAVIMGHIYPIFFKFKGGKGVATMIGGLAAFSPLLCSIYLLTWGIVFAVTRLSSLSALTATITMPVGAWFLVDHRTFPVLLFLAVFIVWRHRSNIRALWTGNEKKSRF
jgi:acyl phosphate:glycerol-3-phosphate acyltransferase